MDTLNKKSIKIVRLQWKSVYLILRLIKYDIITLKNHTMEGGNQDEYSNFEYLF